VSKRILSLRNTGITRAVVQGIKQKELAYIYDMTKQRVNQVFWKVIRQWVADTNIDVDPHQISRKTLIRKHKNSIIKYLDELGRN
jgi:hypothetical protein